LRFSTRIQNDGVRGSRAPLRDENRQFTSKTKTFAVMAVTAVRSQKTKKIQLSFLQNPAKSGKIRTRRAPKNVTFEQNASAQRFPCSEV
jgi:hypothetical protein